MWKLLFLQYHLKPVEGSLYLQTNKLFSPISCPQFNLHFWLIVNCG